jgi:spermidine synthase
VLAWILLDTAQIPGGEDKLRLMRRGSEFSIMLNDIELMNSRVGGSEEALATLSCARISARKEPRILIGGLGMGFTLRAALALLGEKAQLVVAELVPQVVAWARGPLAEVFGASLTDPRVSIEETDVGRLIRSARSTYDAILLDVDNGPEGLTRESNNALYDMRGLSAARAALRPLMRSDVASTSELTPTARVFNQALAAMPEALSTAASCSRSRNGLNATTAIVPLQRKPP